MVSVMDATGRQQMRLTGGVLVVLAVLVACSSPGDPPVPAPDDARSPSAVPPPSAGEPEAPAEPPTPPLPVGWPQQLVIGVAPSSLSAAVGAFGPVGALVSEELGVRVTVRMLQNDLALLGELDADRVDLVLVDPGYLEEGGSWQTATPVLQAVRDGGVLATTAWVSTDPSWSCPQGVVQPEPAAPAPQAPEQPSDDAGEMQATTGQLSDEEPWNRADELAANRDAGAVRCRDVPPEPEEPAASGWTGADVTRLAALPEVVTVVHAAAEGSGMHRIGHAQLAAAREELASASTDVRFAADAGAAVRQLDSVEAGMALVPAAALTDRTASAAPVVVAWGPHVPTEVVLVSDRLPDDLVAALTDALRDVAARPHGAQAWLDLAGVEGWADLDEGWHAALPASAEQDDA